MDQEIVQILNYTQKKTFVLTGALNNYYKREMQELQIFTVLHEQD